MPLDLDFLTHVVNVHWGGGTVFIYGESLGNKLHYVDVIGADAEPTKQTIILPEPALTDETSVFGVSGSSYAKIKVATSDDEGVATLLICGLRSVGHYIDDGLGNMVKVFDRHSLIYISNDGLEWRETRHQVETNFDYEHQIAINAVALVWNSEHKSFYYDQNFSEISPHTGRGATLDQIFSSSKGTSWSMNSSTETLADPTYESAFPSFCENNDCKDERDQNVPDGVMANDLDRTVKPESPPLFAYEVGIIGYTPGENKVVITREEQNSAGDTETVRETVSIPGIGCITCIAGYNGIFLAGGFVAKDDEESPGAVALSTDGGKTWKPFDSTPKGVVTMIAIPKGDI